MADKESIIKKKRTIYLDKKHDKLLDKIYMIFLTIGDKKSYSDIIQEAIVSYHKHIRQRRNTK